MSEREAIERVEEPVTVSSLAADLRELGIGPGDVLLVHSSLSALGWVSGGPQAVVDALREVVTESGTLAMPTHTGQYTDPASWSSPAAPDGWAERVRETMPPFRPAVTPTRRMGAIPECFRSYPDVDRSGHPEVSFAAWGSDADAIVADHGLDFGLGEDSPLSRLYERDADVLLLGVGHEVNTSFHLAEYRADLDVGRVECSAPVVEGGRRVRVEYEDVDRSAADFHALGNDFEERVGSETGSVGAADARLASQQAVVDFAVDWLGSNR